MKKCVKLLKKMYHITETSPSEKKKKEKKRQGFSSSYLNPTPGETFIQRDKQDLTRWQGDRSQVRKT